MAMATIENTKNFKTRAGTVHKKPTRNEDKLTAGTWDVITIILLWST